jgi:hypothetical protein
VAHPKHCWNCGQEVAGKRAESSSLFGVAFCCYCGLKLKANGKCKNKNCKYHNKVPQC